MQQSHLIEDYLITALDFSAEPDEASVRRKFDWFIGEFDGTNAWVKVETLVRMMGYRIIDVLHERGFRVFADLKLSGTEDTLREEAKIIAAYRPEMLTLMGNISRGAISAVSEVLGRDVILLCVTVLTDMDSRDVDYVYRTGATKIVARDLALRCVSRGFAGFVSSGEELESDHFNEPELLSVEKVITAVRPLGFPVTGDHQKRTVTPTQALRAGATRLVVGRPITQAQNPLEVRASILSEMRIALG